jgi:hypothetical protein
MGHHDRNRRIGSGRLGHQGIGQRQVGRQCQDTAQRLRLAQAGMQHDGTPL